MVKPWDKNLGPKPGMKLRTYEHTYEKSCLYIQRSATVIKYTFRILLNMTGGKYEPNFRQNYTRALLDLLDLFDGCAVAGLMKASTNLI